jgi:dienelactone hydrolase
MRGILTSAALLAAVTLGAQTPPELASAQQPDLQTLSTSVRALRRASTVSDDVKAKADKLTAEAQATGQSGEARRRMANAYVLLKGQSWDEKQEYAWSLALRPDQVVADSELPLIVRLTQTYPASYKAANGLKIRLSLAPTRSTSDSSASRNTPEPERRSLSGPAENSKGEVRLAAFDLPARDLIEQPFGLDAELAGKSDGGYTLSAEIADGDAVVATVSAPLQIVRGVATERAVVEKRLARIEGHDGTKATIRYPYVLAETVNVGRRQLSGADFGLPYQPQPVYDFAKGVQTSAGLLKSLESGKDPLFRAKGDSERHYWFEDAREMMAYHVYVPMKWDGKSKLPMVLVLHGNTRDQDYYFDRDDHILARMAEQHGYLVVCPMGYRPSAGWGSNSLNAAAAGQGRGGRGGGGGFGDPMARARQGELSEKDALNVLGLVTKEYPIDAARIYLFGHSAGGAGAWYMGEKYAEKWAAVAASAAATRPAGFPFDRLKGMPIMVCHGDQDDEVPVASSRNMVKAAKENGLDPQYLEVPGATHLTIVAIVEPKVFDFFDQHTRKN